MARRRAGGGLSEEDRTLWAQVARGVSPLSPAARNLQAGPPPGPEPVPTPPAPRSAPPPAPPRPVLPARFALGGGALPPARVHVAHLPSPAERLAAQPLRMDAKAHRALVRGKLRPDARIDLHGLTLAVAKAELTGFILHAQAAGHRLVLVITGKGKGDGGPLPVRSGALRHEVPHWLHMAPLARAVLQVVPAHVRHGGGGAYYVWLRRRRG